MNAEMIVRALGGHRAGASWMACCPAHEDREPSLSISERDGVVLVHCHAGCRQAEVIAALRARALWAGVPEASYKKRIADYSTTQSRERDERLSRERALTLWESAEPAATTLVETYLRWRGIRLSPPPRLRFHRGLRHTSGGVFPAMLALVTHGMDDRPLGVHRTFLAKDGLGKAPVTPQKMMLGPCRSGAVRLGEADTTLMIGEGIETCLSAMQVAGRPAWSALSTSGLQNVEVPIGIEEVTILADGDVAGRRAANGCASRLQRSGRVVRIAHPPAGMDFNDLLIAEASGALEHHLPADPFVVLKAAEESEREFLAAWAADTRWQR